MRRKKARRREAYEAGYEQEAGFVLHCYFLVWDRVERENVLARRLRGEFGELLLNTIEQLLRVALEGKSSEAREWARGLLWDIEEGIGKHGEKLWDKAWKEKKGKRMRRDVLFPRGPIAKCVREELGRALLFWKRLKTLKATCVSARKQKGLRSAGIVPGMTWEEVADKEKIPREYWALVELPFFSVKSAPRWWKFLWPLIKQNNPDLLPKLRGRSIRAERVDPGDVKKGTKRIRPRWASFAKEFRNVLRTLARWWGGVL